ncbi:MAG: DUF11 domain-containing protein, partial [Anaerolineae bacterium]
DNPAPTVGDTVTFTITASNAGPDDATNAAVLDLLPAGVTFISAIPSQGTCIQTNGTVVCILGTLDSGARATMTISVGLTAPGDITNTATVSGNETDPDTTNNVATVSIPVAAPGVRPVGGYGEPLSARALLARWIIAVAAVTVGAVAAMMLRRRIT